MIALVLPVVGVGYLLGVRRLAGRTPSWRRGSARLGRFRCAAFGSALLLLGLALSRPAHEAGETRLWLHMTQHMILVVGVAPLLALSAPAVPLLLLLPVRGRRAVSRWRHRLRTTPGLGWLYLPVTAWLAGLATLWFWHLPAGFDAAERSGAAHALEHLTLLLGAWAFWWHVLHAGPRRMAGVIGVLYVFAATLPMAALGAVLTFARAPLYAEQAAAAAATGFDPLVDQQLAGLVMWIPPDIVYLAVAVALFLHWLSPMARADDLISAPVPADRRPDAEVVP
jgi:cytochrome c oxidase assembly factor CtaG